MQDHVIVTVAILHYSEKPNLLLAAAPAVAANRWNVAKASRRNTFTRIIAVETDLFSR